MLLSKVLLKRRRFRELLQEIVLYTASQHVRPAAQCPCAGKGSQVTCTRIRSIRLEAKHKWEIARALPASVRSVGADSERTASSTGWLEGGKKTRQNMISSSSPSC